MRKYKGKLIGVVLLSVVILALTCLHKPGQAQNHNFLHTEGNRILDSNGTHVLVTGISWFGLETENYAPHGLWARSLGGFLDQIVELGFNTVRLPYSNQLFDSSSNPNGINYDLNPDLEGLTGLEIMDEIIAEAGTRGLKVILDRHRPDSHSQSELWYTPQYSEERWISDWVMLAGRYAGDDTVIGVDLHNEPHGRATWGSNDLATDWRLAAERAGNAILEVNPNLLILVQGVEQYQGEYYWWGGNLMGVRDHPVRLSRPHQLVYSPHTYGPGVYPQKWFSDPSFPENMPGIWDQHWGFVHKEGLAPVILGEFGGRSVESDQEGIWQRALVSYLRENQISYLYWTLNPNSGDTGGILLDDWQSIDPRKKELLSSYQFPLIGSTQFRIDSSMTATPVTPLSTVSMNTPPPITVTPVATLPHSTDFRVLYRTSKPAEWSNESKPEFIIVNSGSRPGDMKNLELVYLFSDDPGYDYEFHCDWAQIGCEKISGVFEPLSDGDHALHISFQSGAGELLPLHDSGEIKLRFNRTDWSEFQQTDDYSFSIAENFLDWDRVMLYSGSQLIWGSEPDQAPESTPSALPTLVSPSAPSTTLPTAALDLTQPSTTVPPNHPSNSTWVLVLFAVLAAGFLLTAIWLFRKNR